MTLYRKDDVALDEHGTGLAGAVVVLKRGGVVQPMFADAAGLQPVSQVTADSAGRWGVYAAYGLYRVEATHLGITRAQDLVMVDGAAADPALAVGESAERALLAVHADGAERFVGRMISPEADWRPCVIGARDGNWKAPLATTGLSATAALQAWQDFCARQALAHPTGARVVCDFQGGSYLLSDTLRVGAAPNLVVCNGVLKPAAGGWTPSKYLLKNSNGASRTFFERLMLDGDRRSSCLQVNGPKSICTSVEAQRWGTNGRGIFLDSGSNGSRLVHCDTHQWTNDDPELLTPAVWSGDGVYVNDHDIKILGLRSYWSGAPLHIGPDANACEVDGITHLFNGMSPADPENPGELPPLDKLVLLVEQGGGVKFFGGYIGNGIIRCENMGVLFLGTRVQYDRNSNARMSEGRYFIEVVADGNNSPRNFLAGSWFASSQGLTNGETPFIGFVDGPSDSWRGNWDYINGLNTPLEADTRKVLVSGRDRDEQFALQTWLSSSDDPEAWPVDVVLGDGTSTVLPKELPGLLSYGNWLRIRNQVARLWKLVGGASEALSTLRSGDVTRVDTSAAAKAFTLPATCPPGWTHTLVQRGANAVSLSAGIGASAVGYGLTLPVSTRGDGDALKIICDDNNGGRTAASFVIVRGF